MNEPPEGGDGVGEALGKVTARMYSIQSNLKADLGPVPMANVELEGSEVKVTIVSLEFLLQVLARKWPEGQTQEDWRRQVEKRLEPTPVALCNYEGGNLPVVRQVRAMITRPGYEVEAVMQVQRDAPAELLIGTDLLSKLGFLFVRTELETEDVDLLEEHFCRAAGEAEGVCETARANSPGRGTGTVCLLQAARLPGHLEGRGIPYPIMRSENAKGCRQGWVCGGCCGEPWVWSRSMEMCSIDTGESPPIKQQLDELPLPCVAR